MNRIGNLFIKINKFSIPYLIILLLIASNKQFLMSLIVVLLHEFTHYCVAFLYGLKIGEIEFLPVGAVIKIKGLDYINYKEDFIISISGPLFNIITAFLLYIVNLYMYKEIITTLVEINLVVGIFNLIPMVPLDGYRILRSILCRKTFYKRANVIALKVSLIISYVIFFIAIMIALCGYFNITFILAGVFSIIMCIKEKNRATYIIMGDMVKKRERFLKIKYLENRSVSVHCKMGLLEVLSIVDKNKYNMFVVLDDDMNFLEILYENDILEGLKKYGNITLSEFIDK